VLRPTASQKTHNAPSCLKSHNTAKSNEPTPTTTSLGVKSQIAFLLSTKDSESLLSSTILLLYKARVTKKRILDDYQKKYGKDCNNSIVVRKKGKTSDHISLDCSQMRPSLDKWYRVGDLHLYNVITTIIKECRVTFSKEQGLCGHCTEAYSLAKD
jgi:hypothetical protein